MEYYAYMVKKLSDGVAHTVPNDLKKALLSVIEAQEAWEDITPLARNEWICWIEEAKRPKTRADRVERTKTELITGVRRPCCWAGCPHRTDGKRKAFVRRTKTKSA